MYCCSCSGDTAQALSPSGQIILSVGDASHECRSVLFSELEQALPFLMVWVPELERLPLTGNTRDRSGGSPSLAW